MNKKLGAASGGAKNSGKNKNKNKDKANTFRPVRFLSLLACIVLAFLVLSFRMGADRVSLSVGEIAGEDVYYQGATTTYSSVLRTEAAQNEAAGSVDPIYVVDSQVAEELARQIDRWFYAISNASLNNDNYTAEVLTDLGDSLPGMYSDEVLLTLLEMSGEDRSSLAGEFKGLVDAVYSRGVTESEIETARRELTSAVTTSTITGNQEVFLKSLLGAMELPYNETYDAVATAAAVEEARSSITPVTATVQSGERLVSRGSQVTAEQIEALQALGMMTEGSDYQAYAGLLVLVSLLLLLLFFYLRIFRREIYNKPTSMLLLAVVVVVVLMLCKLISLATAGSTSDLAMEIGYLLPVSAASMLLAVLLDRDVAILATVVLAAFVGVIMDGGVSYMLVALFGGLAGVLCSYRLNQRSQFVSASVYIIVVNVLVIASWGLLYNNSYRAIAVGALFGLVNGLLSAILAMGLLPFLESGFGITTVIRLLELSNSNHPLLKQLMMEAPGTYNHSVLVGNLAEAAADAIGADALLVRVSSYYHDIGKLKRPYFYIENQRPGENPHDKLQPALSAMIITSHPVDGAKLLRERRFPPEIIDIVEQHHGDCLLNFFYNKAREMAADPDEVRREDFCYKGRPPQTREAALVMLADSVQAGVQALGASDRLQIEARVHEVIEGKREEGQLQECPLTFRDLDIIAQTFLMVLSGMNHIRISYPGQEPNEQEGAILDAAASDHKEEA